METSTGDARMTDIPVRRGLIQIKNGLHIVEYAKAQMPGDGAHQTAAWIAAASTALALIADPQMPPAGRIWLADWSRKLFDNPDITVVSVDGMTREFYEVLRQHFENKGPTNGHNRPGGSSRTRRGA